jgi:hypothetical protein
MSDPFRELGLDPTATPDEVRRARRTLSKLAHPDAGGLAADMQALNAAAAAALELIAETRDGPDTTDSETTGSASDRSDGAGGAADDVRRWEHDWSGQRHDTPSFTVEALPVETFEALLLAAADLGEIEDDDPPYGLSVLLGAPLTSWCRLDVVPDAGASTVSVSIARATDAALPSIDAVRAAWIERLNALDWSQL